MSSNREWGYVVGAVIGYATGGASYIALGATAGGIVGGLLDPKAQTQGPRLDDLKVQFSTYGVGIPRVYGTERVSPNVIWSTDKLETSMTTSAGKGGGVENTSYRYYVQMRLLLCEKPVDGSDVYIVQMFQDGKLIYDMRSGIPVESALASAENPYAFFTLYQGDADQLPDPVEELYESGPGSVPAYRGVVSISMKGIECPGGRVPQFSFVLSNSAVPEPVVEEFLRTDDTRGVNQTLIGVIGASSVVHSLVDTVGHVPPHFVEASYGEAGTLVPVARYQTQQGFDSSIVSPATPIPLSGGTPAFVQLAYATSGDFSAQILTGYRIDASTGATSAIGTFYHQFDTIYAYKWAAYDEATQRIVLMPEGSSTMVEYVVFSGGVSTLLPKPSAGFGAVAAYGGVIHVLASDGLSVTSIDEENGSEIDSFALPGMTPGLGIRMITANETGVYACVINAGGGATGGIFRRAASGYVLLTDQVFFGMIASLMQTFFCNGRIAILGPSISGSDAVYHLIRLSSLDPVAIRISDVIAAECERAGETRYDVTAIPDEDVISGYKISSPASARANIDPMLTAFQIFIVDEDGQIKFKKYEDIESVITIGYEELGQAEDGSEPADPMPLDRTQEIDLPRSVAVSYIEPTNDYQVATEKETRQVTEATEDMLLQLPIALASSDQARRAAATILFSRWRSQNTRSLVVSRKFAFLSPGDGITVEYPAGTFRLWRITRMTDTGTVVELNVEPGDSEIYEQEASGATGYVGQQVAPILSPTREMILDIPILRDQDNNAGPYVALDSLASPNTSAELFVGPDDATLESVGTVNDASPIGNATSVLGDWDSLLVDETNLLSVMIGNDTFTSITSDQLYNSTLNYWALGAPGRWEIGKSKTGASLGDGRYILSGHLRGLFGTEHNCGNHTAGDIFVLLRPEGMLRPNTGVGNIGAALNYRAVTKGKPFDSIASESHVNTGEGLKPLSPVNARRISSGTDITLTWNRRSRLSMNVLSGMVPLGEASESYTVRFYTPGFAALAGTITTIAPTLTITAAQQTAFGLTPGATVYVRIYQNSDSIGLGHELEATL